MLLAGVSCSQTWLMNDQHATVTVMHISSHSYISVDMHAMHAMNECHAMHA